MATPTSSHYVGSGVLRPNIIRRFRFCAHSPNLSLGRGWDQAGFSRVKIVVPMATIQRRKTVTAVVGGVRVGSDAPVVVQSMTNTDTADVPSTVLQVAALARAGSE